MNFTDQQVRLGFNRHLEPIPSITLREHCVTIPSEIHANQFDGIRIVLDHQDAPSAGYPACHGLRGSLRGSWRPLAQENLFAALFLIMICSLILGMGLPSAVCYLLLATFIGSVLGDLGIVPLAGHFFIFYFGMMSMVTPPVALAAYAAATIAGSGIMVTAWRAFSFALVGFTLPYMFVLQPELLLLDSSGDAVSLVVAIPALSTAVLGITALAGSLAGFFFSPLNSIVRGILFLSAALLLYPADFLRSFAALLPTLAGLILLVLCVSWSWYRRHPSLGGSG